MKSMKKTDGFTLVELIVVIAILAILGGVAVPAYSGYVTKANQQADISLVGEVKDALMLYYYNNYGTEVEGYVVLTPEGEVCTSGGVGKDAMDMVFGAGWENTLSLKYDGWIKKVDGSPVDQWEAEDVADTVTNVTMLANIATAGNDPDTAVAVLGMFLDGMATELEAYKNDPNFATIATNLMVKYVSEEMKDIQFKKDENGGYALDSNWDYIFVDANGNETSKGTNFAVRYSMLYAMANDDSFDKQELAQEKLEAFEEAMKKLAEDEAENPTGTSVVSGLDTAWEALRDPNLENAMIDYIEVDEKGDNALAGISSAMDTVNSIAQGYNSAESLGNADLYNKNMIQTAVNYYKIANDKGGVVIYIDENGDVESLPKVS